MVIARHSPAPPHVEPPLGEESPTQDLLLRLREAPWWALSAVLHVLVLLLAGSLVLTRPPEKRLPQRAVAVRLPSKKAKIRYRWDLPRDLQRKPEVLRPKEKTRFMRVLKPDVITAEIPRGLSPDAMANKPLGANRAADAFGVGSGGAGMFGLRGGQHSAAPGGATAGSESAVLAALDWLARHQNPDGSWSCAGFTRRCNRHTGPCRNHPRNKPAWGNDQGRGWKEHDIGVTALAVLAFTGAGHTHTSGNPRFQQVVRKAARFLRSVQIRGTGDPRYDGCFRFKETIPGEKSKELAVDEELQWMYDHAIATLAAAELLAMSSDFQLRRTVREAAAFSLRAQTPDSGWRYSVRSPTPDTSVTGWLVLALKTVRSCLLLDLLSRPTEEELRRSFQGALKWFDLVTSQQTGRAGYQTPGDMGSTLRELRERNRPYPFSKDLSCMTAVSVLCRLFAGERPSRAAIRKGIRILLEHPPRWRLRQGNSPSTINFYYWYYGSLAVFQYGKAPWKRWNEAMKKALLPTQRRAGDASGGGCANGSWDPVGEWGLAGGRVYSTALGALTLEVYYRYRRVSESAFTTPGL